MKIYYKPSCSKCRIFLNAWGDKNAMLIDYLSVGITEENINEILTKSNYSVDDLIRKSEEMYSKKLAGKKLTNKQKTKLLIKHPILFQRPIAVSETEAFIVRDEEMITLVCSLD